MGYQPIDIMSRGILLNVDPLTGQLQDPQDLINSMKTHGIVPMNGAPSTASSIELVKDPDHEIYQLIEYAGDLLAIGRVSQSEWFRLKALVKTGHADNLNLVMEILNAKSTDKE